ncbi:MAG: hypothetical protein JWM80_1765 [Cyanobacteria bacterium RYN_339]|nr:hypothetical protein [Cyanobacteria bacterium RYN_339]
MPNLKVVVPLALALSGATLAFVGCSGVLPPALYPSPNVGSGGPGGAATSTLSFRGDVVPILQQHCAACHAQGGMGAGKVLMFDPTGPRYDVVRVRIKDMLQMIKDGKMPLGKPNSVPADQVATLQAWSDAGAPEGTATAPPASAASATPAPTPAAAPSASAAPVSPGPTASAAATVAFQDVVPILRSHCATCHVTGGIGPFAMFDAGGTPQYGTVKDHLAAMIGAIKSGKMPLGNPGSVPANEVALLEAWQAAGAPEAAAPGASTIPATASPVTASPTPTPAPTPVVSLPPFAGTVAFTADVVPILRTHCSQCHVTGGIGPFAMFDAAGTPQYQTVHDRISAMVAAIEGNRMPLGKPGTVPADQLAKLKAWSAAGAPKDPDPNATPTPVGQTPAPVSTPTPNPTRATVSFKNHVVPILNAHCAGCHSFGGQGAGKVLMFGATGLPNYRQISDNIGDMVEMIQTGKMPKGAPGSVPASEIQALKDWSAAGKPNN